MQNGIQLELRPATIRWLPAVFLYLFAILLPGIGISQNAPSIDCGQAYSFAEGFVPFVKTDIVGSDPDNADNLVFFPVIPTYSFAGPWEVDRNTGVFTVIPDHSQDIGIREVCIGVSDGADTAECCFQIEVIPCSIDGDANCDGHVNLSDAVLIINYIFRNGFRPPILNWADANADCDINIADAVYLIDFIFKSGLEPQTGCVGGASYGCGRK